MPGEEFGAHLTFALFRYLDRRYIQSLRSKYDVADLQSKYRQTGGRRFLSVLFSLIVYFGLTAAMIYGCYLFFYAYAHRDPDLQFFFGFLEQLFAAVFVGFIAASSLMIGFELFVAKMKFGERMHEFVAWECIRQGFDVYRRTMQIIMLIGVPFLVLSALSLDTYTFVTSREVVLNPFWGFGETRQSFQQVATLKGRSFMGNKKEGKALLTYHSIHFKDGTEWHSRDRGSITPREQQEGQQIVEYISQQTGLPIVKAPMDP